MPWPLLWSLALGLLALFAGVMLWRRRSAALAGGPDIDAFVPSGPEVAAPVQAPPAPAPEAPAAPGPVSRPVSAGIISTRLRSWIEVGIQPLRCTLDPQQFTLDLELELFNSGSSPARAVLAEAVLISGATDQDQQIAAFFNRQARAGGRLESIGPLQRLAVNSQLVASHDQLHPVDVGGRQVLVPIVALDVRYQWSGGEGQTAFAWLVGRDTGAERLAPIRMDLVPRVYRTLGIRPMPLNIRR